MKGQKSKKGNKKKRKVSLVTKLKRGATIGIVGFFVVGIALNSAPVTEYKDSVYASLKSQYIQIVDNGEEIIVEKKEIKNLHLDVNSDLRIPSNVTAEDIDKMLEGTALHGLGYAFVKAEKQYGVNALYMMGLACLESGWGTSKYAVNRNNLYGWNAVDSNPDKAKYFSSKEEATMFVSQKLKQNYLTEGGAYFEGYSARAVDVHYCTDKKHADKIVNIVAELVEKLG